MFHIRTTKTSSLSTAIQVVRYEGKRTIILKHIGSAKKADEVLQLKRIAHDFIQKLTKQQSLFNLEKEETAGRIIQLDKCRYLGVRCAFIYEQIRRIFTLFDFDDLGSRILLDLVMMRIVEPTSKLHSLELLKELFGICYSESDIYRSIGYFASLKESVEKKIVLFAKKRLSLNFNLIFYDVTTLYFETDKDDAFRRYGFSKDNKFNQPQILIGLIVNDQGFPISFDIFEGNKFEGHTLLPAITEFKNKHQVKKLTVVADAAMISLDNIKQLKSHRLSYIVAARLSNLNLALIKKIGGKIGKTDGDSIRIKTDNGFLVCDFSQKRYSKDNHELEKQIKKTNLMINDPSKAVKRSRFLKNTGKTKYALNQQLIDRAKLLLGIKGYYTNLRKPNKFIIYQYHQLWKIEKSFRIAKSDLKIRPIYHFKMNTIKAHILICFMALAVCKYMEIKTNKSTQKVIRLFKSITDARILNTITNEMITLRLEISSEIKQLLDLLRLPY